jgi:hypothetical protein
MAAEEGLSALGSIEFPRVDDGSAPVFLVLDAILFELESVGWRRSA